MQINTTGKVFEEALTAVRPELDETGKKEIRNNAARLLKHIVTAFEASYGSDPLGGEWSRKGKDPQGLVYGRIQSGKTRAMITTSAMAVDNGFKIVIVLTSNNNRLTDQTHKDFQRGLPGIKVLCKRDLKKNKLALEKDHLQRLLKKDGGPGVVVVTSKNHKSLADIATFLKVVKADVLPAIVFDDEGDEASLDTNTRKRSLGEVVPESRIHSLIHGREGQSVRETLFYEVFVSVTGTPQAILLQSKDTNYDVSFIDLLEPGSSYVGGETFFPDPDPKQVIHSSLVGENEKFVLLDETQEIPNGLKDAICFFILAAVAAAAKNGAWDEYKLLCHPSVKQKDHTAVHKQVSGFIESIIMHLSGEKRDEYIDARFRVQYANLQKSATDIPDLPEILKTATDYISQREIFIINAKTTDESLAFVPHFNFMIGGNSIGRGLAIRNLLVTYYVREPKIANMDTMYQHARMFGYRRKTMPYTRVFLPYQLYSRFRSIYESDEKTREYIAMATDKDSPLAIEVDIASLRPTRKNVIDANAVVTVLPGSQLFPDRPIYHDPQASAMRRIVMRKLVALFPDYDQGKKGREGIDIRPEDAVALLKSIKTDAANSWSDKMVRDQLRSVASRNGDRVRLRYRKAPGRQGEERGGRRVMPQAVLSGADVTASQAIGYPVLWIFEVGEEVLDSWAGSVFIYPTVIFPIGMKAFVFNKR
ncbi:MAG: Z1 domain-containing protein [Patescibacteria group bacterium]